MDPFSAKGECVGDSTALETVVSILNDEVRREVVTSLREASHELMSVDELVERLQDRHGRTLQNLHLRLHHVDLPKLVDAGLIEFDPRSDRLQYFGDDDVEKILDILQEEVGLE